MESIIARKLVMLNNSKGPRDFWELLSNLVFEGWNQAAIWTFVITSSPFLNLTPLMTFAK